MDQSKFTIHKDKFGLIKLDTLRLSLNSNLLIIPDLIDRPKYHSGRKCFDCTVKYLVILFNLIGFINSNIAS